MPPDFWPLFDQLNVVSRDNGKRFTHRSRLEALDRLLAGTPWQPLHQGPLSFLHAPTQPARHPGRILVSSHVDALYGRTFRREAGHDRMLGTFDNAITNAILLDLLRADELPSSVLVAFTGDEERSSQGARETVSAIAQRFPKIWDHLEMVVTLDVTAEAFPAAAFTLENTFVEKQPNAQAALRFPKVADFGRYLASRCGEPSPVWIAEGDADETYAYAESDVNCLSFCLPCGPQPGDEDDDWMHLDTGFLIATAAVPRYRETLKRLLHGVDADLAATAKA